MRGVPQRDAAPRGEHRGPGRALTLHKDLGDALRAGHPWVYRDALRGHAPLPSGQAVDVLSPAGAFLARGLYDAESPIAVRVYTLDPAQAIDEALLGGRLAAALASRRGLLDLSRTTAFRLCNGEGDHLPGVVVDVYGPVAVLRLDGQGPAALRPQLAHLLRELLGPLGVETIYERSPERSGAGDPLLHGPPPPAEIVVREHGVPFVVDVVHGQKTGHFLDMRDNRLLVRQIAAGLSVWNGFCYSGGFSLQAALGGARSVVSVDSARGALETARRNFALSGLEASGPDEVQAGARFPLVCEDVFPHLRRAAAMGLRYELVIADPPSFAPRESALPRALAAYRDLAALCARVVAPGGLLAAGSCSSHVTMEAFLGAVGAGAVAAGRACRVVEVRGQPADHPSLPAFPEGRYLKFVLCRLD